VHVDPREATQRPDYPAKNRYGQLPCLSSGKINWPVRVDLEDLADALGNMPGRPHAGAWARRKA
jgi:hypothetical protein